MGNVDGLLEDRLEYLYKALEKEPIGTNEHTIMVNELKDLSDIRNRRIEAEIDKDKIFNTLELEWEKFNFEKEKTEYEKKSGAIYKAVDASCELAKVVIPPFFICGFAKVITNYEQTGILSSNMWKWVPKFVLR